MSTPKKEYLEQFLDETESLGQEARETLTEQMHCCLQLLV